MHNEDTLIGGPLNRTDKQRAEIAGLTKDQQKAYQELIEFINKPFNPNDFKRALVGAGGVGKTFLLKTILKNCNISFSQIGVSAPSHKACRVIRDSLGGLPVNINTIQSDFGMRPDYNIDTFNERDIQFSKLGRIKVEDYNLYVVDESSMINKALFNFMSRILINNCCKLLLLGDVDQVPPVNELEPSAFKNVTTYRLTQIVRQEEDNPIREICSMLRNDVENNTFTFLNYISTHKSKFDSTMTKGFMVCNSAEFQHQVELQFSDEAITKNTDYVKVVAYTNMAVSAWNKFIREAIIKDSEKSVITKNDLITSGHCLRRSLSKSPLSHFLSNALDQSSYLGNDSYSILPNGKVAASFSANALALVSLKQLSNPSNAIIFPPGKYSIDIKVASIKINLY